MKILIILPLLLALLFSCNDSTPASEDDDISTCLGFGSPNINISVNDSLNEGTKIETANVNIHFQDGSNDIISATFIPEEDNNTDTDTGSYWALLNANSNDYEISIVISDLNYHTHVTRNILVNVDTSCGADNGITYTAYLCPLSSSCL